MLTPAEFGFEELASVPRRFDKDSDQIVYATNVLCGRPLCETCGGSGNAHQVAFYSRCPDCFGAGYAELSEAELADEALRRARFAEEMRREERAAELATGPYIEPGVWPEWAIDEDGEYLWVRADLAHDAAAVDRRVAESLGCEPCALGAPKSIPMVYGLSELEGFDEWWIRAAHPEEDQMVRLYMRFERGDELG